MKFNPEDCKLDFYGTLKVSEGKETFPYMTIMTVDDTYYYLICHEKGKMPDKEDLLFERGVLRNNNGTWQSLGYRNWTVLQKAFNSYKENLHKGLVPFSFLAGACAALGVDLFDYVD